MIGAGVVGLTSAVRLLEDGHRVDVLARDLPLETTSVVAAALWYPYRAGPADRVAAWGETSYDVFAGLAPDEATGVRMLSGVDLSPGPETRRLPVIDTPVYLAWLAGRVAHLGGTVTRMNVTSLPTPLEDGLVVNCSGIGARHLAADPTVGPVQGQVVYVEQFGLHTWHLDPAGPTYVVPRSREVVVGGTDVEGEWSRTPSEDVTAQILSRATHLVPALAQARVLRTRVGLRPARPEVRVERVGRVIHCYGHGGSGVTLSWGTAAEVVSLARGVGR